MDGRGENSGWQGSDWQASPYRDDSRGGRDDRRGYGDLDPRLEPRYDYGDDPSPPAPRPSEQWVESRGGYPPQVDLGSSRGEPRDFGRGPRSGESPPPMPSGAAFGSGPPPFEPAAAYEQQRSFEPVGERGPLREKTGLIDAAAVRRSVAETDGLYRSKRPGFAALAGLIVALGELLMVRPLLANAFEIGPGAVSGALAPLLAMIAFPLFGLGLYALLTGAATAVQFQGPRVWLRAPLVYLILGVALLMAAGTAAA